MSEPVSQRIVPGAPPPAPLSKSQKKKRKGKKPTDSTPESPTILDLSSAAPTEKAPESVETREGSIAPEPSAQPESLATPIPEEDLLLKHSPIVELVTKRLKATTKKIVRCFPPPQVEIRSSLTNFF
jgi:hypothetical protein